MNRTIKYALSAVLSIGLVMPVLAQDNFPDVPANHWAYQAIANLKKDGVLVGYPDGMFHGARPATRYEMAVAINAAYQNLKGITDGLNQQISAINDKLNNGTGNSGDLDDLRNQLKDLQSQVDGMKSYGSDIDDLKKLTSNFETELTSMGVDVKSMKDELNSLADRVTALEKAKLPFNVHGEFDSAAFAGYSTSGTFGLTTTGRFTGVGHGNGFNQTPVGVLRDLTVFNNLDVAITSNTDGPVSYKIVGATGNILSPNALGNQSQLSPGTGYTPGNNTFWLQQAEASFKAKLGGLGLDVNVGRIGYKISPWIFQRPNVDPYFHNSYYNNGEWAIDGGAVSIGVGKGALTILVGTTGTQTDSSGTAFQPMTAGAMQAPYTKGNFMPVGISSNAINVSNVEGANLSIPLGSLGKLDLAYLYLDTQDLVFAGANQVDRVSDYGGNLNLHFGNIHVDGGYARTPLMYNNSKVSDTDDFAYWVNAGYHGEKWGLGVGYQFVEPLYAAPGSWGRIGIWWNPTDIKGVTANAHFNVSNNLELYGKGQFFTGVGSALSGLTTSDKITTYELGLGYKISPEAHFSLGYEYDQFNLASAGAFAGGKPLFQWYNIGFGYDLSHNTNLSVLWQISNYNSQGVAGWTNPFNGSTTAKGGLITTQLSIKF